MQHVWLLRRQRRRKETAISNDAGKAETRSLQFFCGIDISTKRRRKHPAVLPLPSVAPQPLCGRPLWMHHNSQLIQLEATNSQIMFKPQVEGRTQRQRHGRRSLGPMTPRTRTRATIVGLLITDLCRCQPVKIVFAVDRDLLAIHARMGGGPGVGSGDWRIDDLAKHKYEHVSHSLVFEVFQCCLRAQSAKGLARKQVRRAMQYLQNLYISAHAHFRIASTTTASTCVFVFIIIILGLFGFVHPTDAIVHSSCLTI